MAMSRDMRKGMVFILTLLLFARSAEANIVEGEARIYRLAPIGTAVTLHPDFVPILDKFRGCFGRMVHRKGESHNFEWLNPLWTVRTQGNISRALGEWYEVKLHFFCADGETNSMRLSIIVSKENIFAPEFDRHRHEFYVAKLSEPGTLIGKVGTFDQDPVIYNSQLTKTLQGDEAGRFFLGHDGKIWLRHSFDFKVGSKKLFLIQLKACDYGSPQICSTANVVIHAVTLTGPKNVSVNLATPEYQIVEWKRPEFGVADEFHVSIVPETMLEGTQDQDSYYLPIEASISEETYQIVTRKQIQNPETRYFLIIYAINLMDRTPSEPILLSPIQQNVTCDSPCHPNNSIPICYTQNLGKDGRFQQWRKKPNCICEPGYTGDICSELDKCDRAVSMTRQGPTVWSKVEVNTTAHASCPYGPREVTLSRRCIVNFTSSSPEWGRIDHSNLSQCHSRDALLTKLALSGIMTFNNKTINPARLRYFTETLESIWYTTYADKKVAQNGIDLIGQVVGLNISSLPPHIASNITTRLLNLLKLYTDKVLIPQSSTKPPLRRGSLKQLSLDSNSVSVIIVDVDREEDVEPLIIAPTQEEFRKESPPWSLEVNTKLLKKGDRFTAVYMKNSSFYQLEKADERKGSGRANPVLEMRIRGREEREFFSEPVVAYSVQPYASQRNPQRYTCVYYSENERRWKTDGVVTHETGDTDHRGRVACSAYHLTGFSILLDFQSHEELDARNRFILNLLSWIGCALSMTGLFLTILTYSIFRSLNRDGAGKILLNLCAAMFVLNGAFILSSLRPFLFYSQSLCTCIGALLHFATLSSLLWMGVEAANMYHMLVQVFAFNEHRFLLKRNLVAWGVPALIVLVTVSVNSGFYVDKDDYYCRISKNYPLVQYGTYLAPACIILFANCVVFVIVVKVLILSTKTSVRKTSRAIVSAKKSQTIAIQVRGALTVMILLGITWVFGVFAVGPARIPFMYIFCILNSLQGFIIFVVRCLCYHEARDAWAIFLKTGRLKQHRGHQFVTGGTTSNSLGPRTKANESSSTTNTTLSDPKNGTSKSPTSEKENSRKTSLGNGSGQQVANSSGPRSKGIPRVTVSETKEPLLSTGEDSSDSRSPPVRVRQSPSRRLGKLSFGSWKYVDDPPSPRKAPPSCDSPLGPFGVELNSTRT